MNLAALYFHTLRHLRPIQIYEQLALRLRRRVRLPPRTGAITLRGIRGPLPHVPASLGAVSDDLRMTFLNATRASVGLAVDWAASDMPRLWRYNLHYFDFLLDPQLSDERKSFLLDGWIRANPQGAGDAWDPYPVSLRIVNWVKYFLSGRTVARGAWLESLSQQALWLEQRLEYHLLANHLLKNGVALCFAGGFFSGPQADRWLRRGWRIVAAETAEQFLPDGGHFERSPMYHSIALLDCLDVLGLEVYGGAAVGAHTDKAFRARLTQAAAFLRDIVHPDGEIPLFNDAAIGIAPPPTAVLEFADELLGGGACLRAGRELVRIDKPDTGYFGFRRGGDLLLVDCGRVGPDYQPGHAHCDTLSYELSLSGRRVIVDAGVYEYESGRRRHYCRSTAAHNTVVVDDAEQSQIWGAFRVARRARPTVARAAGTADGGWLFEGAHDGYRRLPGKPRHHRRIRCDPAGTLEVTDEIEGLGSHRAETRIRLHPGCKTVINGRYAHVSGPEGAPVLSIEFLEGLEPQLEEGVYFPQFGRELTCDVLVARRAGRTPLRLSYRIVKAPDNENPVSLSLLPA